MPFVNSLGYTVPFGIPLGGTGLNTNAQPYGVICAGTTLTGAYNQIAVGASGFVLTSNGPSAYPTWQVLPGDMNLTFKNAVQAASTSPYSATYSNGVAGVGATLINNGAQVAFSIDGQTPSVGARVLIKNQTTALQNGIYEVTDVGSGATDWVLTRTTDYDAVAEISDGDLVFVNAGSTNAQQLFAQQEVVTTVGTDNINFSRFTAGSVQSVSGTTDRITITGTTANPIVDIASTYVGQNTITTLGTVTTGTWNGTTIDVAYGGTGATTFTAYSPIFAGTTATGVMQSISIGTAGQVLTSNGAGVLASFQNASVKLPFVTVAGTSQTAVANFAYGLQNAAQVTVTIDASANFAVGDIVEIEGYGANGFIVDFVGTQVCNAYGGGVTTSGGTITTRDPLDATNSAPGCKVTLRYTASNTFWLVQSTGNFVFA